MTREQSIVEYHLRVNKSIDFIKSNLDKELLLENVAAVSNFSKYHYHRIFKSIAGTSLHEFVKTARLEKALYLVMNSPDKTIDEIALDCGFTNSSFTKSFNELRKTNARKWKMNCKEDPDCLIEKKNSFAVNTDHYLRTKNEVNKNFTISNVNSINVEIRELPEKDAIYIRNLEIDVHDSTSLTVLFDSFFRWRGPENRVNFPVSKVLTVFRSSHNLLENVQVEVCLTVPELIHEEGLVGDKTITGGLYAIIYNEAPIEECFAIWDYIFEIWFVENGYQPDNRDFYIEHLNDPKTHPQNLHLFEVCIPIKSL